MSAGDLSGSAAVRHLGRIEHPEWCSPPCPVEWDEQEQELLHPHRGQLHDVEAEKTEITANEFVVALYQWPGHPTRVELVVGGEGRALALLTPATARAYAALLVEVAEQAELAVPEEET